MISRVSSTQSMYAIHAITSYAPAAAATAVPPDDDDDDDAARADNPSS